MLVFIDESGDTGRKLDSGSSRYFIVSLVLFEEHDDAVNCDQRINLLRKELKLPDNYEFHFAENSHRIRLTFLNAIQPYKFLYFSVAIDKSPEKLWGPGFQTKESFYKYACQMVFTNALPYLKNATVVLDQSGSPDFRSRLSTYLKNKLNTDADRTISKIKQQRSSSNNLLQLADYVSGVVNRKIQGKKDWSEYYRFLNDKEIWVQVWPK
ncbi:MAG: hypothetical protein A2X34_02220 [Elusimicrobia bacterium GWC2_51_8]|nr:MAG: hypothetical protein A2X33_05305 [Elusimicrobia bacterium GWA2_51_34]OGR59654.1 MAG: hypothetical protein A2X34_02220 [Elusimicrobia bacterium GWC2_51_8]HAF95997.1 hypothetical protein [Elusimicrobiota bacterium]HCE97006.1 hypothetical protein [Elusimicrobiota bacterium]